MKTKIFRVILLLLGLAGTAFAQSTITRAEYFLDVDPGVGFATPLVITPGDSVVGDFSINMQGLSTGWHYMAVRVRDDLERWSIVFSHKIHIYETIHQTIEPTAAPLILAEYFFDTDPGQGNGTPIHTIRGDTINLERYLPIASLDTGMHRLHIRAKDQRGLWGLAKWVDFKIDTSDCEFPVVDFTYDTVTWGTPVTFTNQSQNAPPGTSWQWDIGNNDTVNYYTENATHIFPFPGVYQVKLTSINDTNCSAAIIKNVHAGPLPKTTLLIEGLLEFCEGDSILLTSDNDPLVHQFEWSNGNTTQQTVIRESGNYYAWVTNQYGNFVKSEVISVLVHDTPEVLLTYNDASGGHANGMAYMEISGGTGNYNILWSTGESYSIVNNLAPGDYTVNVDDGFCPVTRFFTVGNNPINPGNIVSAEYFIDTDPGVGNAIPLNISAGDEINFATRIPFTGIPPGYHVLSIHVKDTYGAWSVISQNTIYVRDSTEIKIPVQPPIVEAEYFLNTEPLVGNGISLPIIPGDTVIENFNLPGLTMPLGYHQLMTRVKDDDNRWSIANGQKIFVYDDTFVDLRKTMKGIGVAEYFFDSDPGAGNGTPLTFNIYDTVDIERFFRVESLDPGSHYFYLRVQDEDGNWSLAKRQPFEIYDVNCTCPIVEFTADTVDSPQVATTFVNLSQNIDPGAWYEWDVENDGIVDYTTLDITHSYADFGIYDAKLSVYNSDSCFASYIREVVVSPPIDTSLTLVGPTAFCDGDSLTINAQPGYTYNWNTGETTQSIKVKNEGNYRVRLTNAYGVQNHSRSVQVSVYPLPVVEVTVIDANPGQANGTALVEVTGGSGNYNYQWSTGGTLPIENNLTEGDHSITVDDGNCPVTINFYMGQQAVNPGDIVEAEYFFDADPGLGNGFPLNISGSNSVYFATYLPVQNVSVGYHVLSIRVKDTKNQWSIPLSKTIFVYPDTNQQLTVNQPPMVAAEYFINDDPGPGHATPIQITQGDTIIENFALPTAGLSPGYYTLGLRVMDSLYIWSLARHFKIQIMDTLSHIEILTYKIVEAEYFYDDDPGVGKGTAIPFNPTADSIEINRAFRVGTLDPGSHKLYVRVKDENKNWSLHQQQSFSIYPVSCDVPLVDFTYDTVIQGSVTQFTNLSQNTNPSTLYEWDVLDDGVIDFTTRDINFNFNQSGVFDVRLNVINTDSCFASVVRQVFVGPMPFTEISLSGPTEFCEGDSIMLSAPAGYIYEWWPGGETSQSISVKSSGTYYAWINTNAGIELKSEIVNVMVYQNPQVNLTIVDASGGNANGSAYVEVEGGSGNYNYLWSNGSSEFYANDLVPGVHSVQINDGHCPIDTTFVIENRQVYPGNILAAEYYFNSDPGVGYGLPLNVAAGDTMEFLTGIPVDSLPLGYHTLNVRAMDTEQRWSQIHMEKIHVYDTSTLELAVPQPPLTYAEYFIDINIDSNPDPGPGHGTDIAVTPGDMLVESFQYPVDSLLLGYHKVFVRTQDEWNKWGHFLNTRFHIYDTTYFDLTVIQPGLKNAEYFIDDDPGVGNAVPVEIVPGDSVSKSFAVDLGALNIGEHYLYVRVMDSLQRWSSPARAGFEVFDCVQPEVDFTFIQVCIEDSVHFTDLSASVGTGAIYEWDIDNDGVVDYNTVGDLVHKYDDPGIYEVKLKITHNVACFDSIIKTVVFPYVNLGNDTTIFEYQEIILDAGPDYASYLWNDGSVFQTLTVTGPDVGVGTHEYYVTISNDLACTASDTIDITISSGQVLDLPVGWSGISSCLVPENDSIHLMFEPVLDNTIIMYNNTGMFWPVSGINTLETWDNSLGYIAKMAADEHLVVYGNEVLNRTVDLETNWNLIPVLSSSPADISTLFASYQGSVFAKEVAGSGVYWPEFNINTLPYLNPGKAYYVHVESQGSITFDPGNYTYKSAETFVDLTDSPWGTMVETPNTHVVAFDNNSADVLKPGDVIGAFTKQGVLAGLSKYDGAQAGMTIFGDDIFSEVVEGFADDEPLRFRIYRPSTDEIIHLEVSFQPVFDNTGLFKTFGLSVIDELKVAGTKQAGIHIPRLVIFPNPTHSVVNISGVEKRSKIQVYNAFGMMVLKDRIKSSGKLDLSGLPKGMYVIKIINNNYVWSEKIIID